MQQALLIAPILIPVIFWAGYHYYKDRAFPEPPMNLFACLILGVIGFGLAALMYAALEPLGLRFDALELAENNTAGLFAYCLLAIGPIEELAKLAPFLLVVLRFKALDEPMDGIIYASFIGLGFAAAENVLYLDYLSVREAIARGFAGPVIHMLFASVWAHWITRARLRGASILGPAIVGFALAATLHGLYDFLVLLKPGSALPAAAALIIGVWIWRLALIHRLHNRAIAGVSKD